MISKIFLIAVAAFLAFTSCITITAQSTDPDFPTNLTSNEIDGTIRARDVGDARLTSYYYTFDGGQGDIFINVVSSNFTGDIDIFAAEGLRPLAKIVLFADGNVDETGRLIYMRKPERLILRVQGRTPNDDPATYRVKFGGSFIAMSNKNDDTSPKLGRTEEVSDAGIKVNSVGTIVAVIPKPQPPKKTVEPPAVAKTQPKTEPQQTETKATPEVTVTENIPVSEPPVKAQPTSPVAQKAATEPATVFGGKPKAKSKTTLATAKAAPKTKAAVTKTKTAPVPPVPADPLANIHLVVLFKNGNKIERPMSEVDKFTVDRGVLTVITKDGNTVNYPILDVAKVTIQ